MIRRASAALLACALLAACSATHYSGPHGSVTHIEAFRRSEVHVVQNAEGQAVSEKQLGVSPGLGYVAGSVGRGLIGAAIGGVP